jgi:hypothetical protein
MKITLPLSMVLAAAVLASCSLLKKPSKDEENQDKPKVEPPKLVGRVASIPHDRKFLLIQSYGPWKADVGTILTTRGPENRAANLRVTGEKLGDFAAADLQSGDVEIGDGVYAHHAPKPPETPAEPEVATQVPEPQKIENTENVQKNN